MVEQSTTMPGTFPAPSAASPPGPKQTSSASLPVASMAKTTSALQRSSTLSTITAPSFANGSALARVRFHTLTLCPASSKRVTIGKPMRPMPIQPMSILFMASRAQATTHRLDDAALIGQNDVFERIGRGQRHMRGGNAHRRPVEIVEGFVGDDRHDLRPPAAETRILLDRENPVRARNRVENRPGVERHERAEVDHLAIDSRFA